MQVPVVAPPYSAARLRAAGAFLRQWASEQYGEDKIRGLLFDNLGVPHYRPAYVHGEDYSKVMKEFADNVVYIAQRAAASSERYVDNRPVVYALRNIKSRKQ